MDGRDLLVRFAEVAASLSPNAKVRDDVLVDPEFLFPTVTPEPE